MADLALDRREIGALLALHGAASPTRPSTSFMTATEGWPAGLCLSLLAGRRNAGRLGRSPAVRGDQRAIASFLTEEVLERQPGSCSASSCARRSWTGSPRTSVDGGRDDRAGNTSPHWRATTCSWPRSTTAASGTATTISSPSCWRRSQTRRAPEELPELHRRAAAWHLSSRRARPRGAPLARSRRRRRAPLARVRRLLRAGRPRADGDRAADDGRVPRQSSSRQHIEPSPSPPPGSTGPSIGDPAQGGALAPGRLLPRDVDDEPMPDGLGHLARLPGGPPRLPRARRRVPHARRRRARPRLRPAGRAPTCEARACSAWRPLPQRPLAPSRELLRRGAAGVRRRPVPGLRARLPLADRRPTRAADEDAATSTSRRSALTPEMGLDISPGHVHRAPAASLPRPLAQPTRRRTGPSDDRADRQYLHDMVPQVPWRVLLDRAGAR